MMESAVTIPLKVDQALQGRGFLKGLLGGILSVKKGGTGSGSLSGILKGNGTAAITSIAGVSGSFYAANSSGGSPTHLVTVTNGVITSIS